MDLDLLLLQWTGAITGILGAALLALNVKASRYGFVAYLISNVCWISYAMLANLQAMMVMQIAFMAISIIGLLRWFSRREVRERRPGWTARPLMNS